jgi:hypothetical protein
VTDPTHTQAVCVPLRGLGGAAKVAAIRTEIERRWGGTAWLRRQGSNLDRVLVRENGRLWLRTSPGTYEITEEGRAAASEYAGTSDPTLDKDW